MATTEDLKRWFNVGLKRESTHLLVVRDTYDHEAYPVYADPGEPVQSKLDFFTNSHMQRVVEVYSLKKPFDQQKMKGHFCWDLE